MISRISKSQSLQQLKEFNIQTDGKDALINELRAAGVEEKTISNLIKSSGELSKFLDENKNIKLAYGPEVYFNDSQFMELQTQNHENEIKENDIVMGKNGSVFNANEKNLSRYLPSTQETQQS